MTWPQIHRKVRLDLWVSYVPLGCNDEASNALLRASPLRVLPSTVMLLIIIILVNYFLENDFNRRERGVFNVENKFVLLYKS